MSPRGEPREHRFTMVMTNEEREMLDELAATETRSASDWLRVAIRKAHDERFPKKTKAKK